MIIDIGLFLTYILVAGGAGTALYFAIKFGVSNPRKSQKSITGVAILLAVMIFSFALASNKPLDFYGFEALSEKLNLNPGTIKRSGAGLITFYVFGIGALVAAIYYEISKFLRNKNG